MITQKMKYALKALLVLGDEAAKDQPQALTIDYVVHHVKANGDTSPKVFKGWNVVVPPGATVTLVKRHTVKPITTRRYYPGRHPVVIQANGAAVAEAYFDLRMPQ